MQKPEMNKFQIMSPVKKEKLKRLEKLMRRKKMRESLPILDKDEIRRHRLGYDEAVILELQDHGFINTSSFLSQLFKFQEDLRNQHGPDTVVWVAPRLADSRHHIDNVIGALKRAETAHLSGNLSVECDEFIKIGTEYALGPEVWWWLGEQLLNQAVSVSCSFNKDNGRRQAISKYIMGKYFLENVQDIEEAKEYLSSARMLSTSKSWNATKDLGFKQDTVFVESCKLLHQAHMIEGRRLLKIDPVTGIKLAIIAKKRAIEACDHQAEADAVMLQGLCEMEAGDPSSAIESFLKVLVMQTKLDKKEMICQTHIYVALAFSKSGKYSETLHYLQDLMEIVKENHFKHYQAETFKYLGEYYLNQGRPATATQLLNYALKSFIALKNYDDINQTKNMAAISMGQELLPTYVKLILDSQEDKRCLYQIVRWKDVREQFWNEEDRRDSAHSLSQFADGTSMVLEQNDTESPEDDVVDEDKDHGVAEEEPEDLSSLTTE